MSRVITSIGIAAIVVALAAPVAAQTTPAATQTTQAPAPVAAPPAPAPPARPIDRSELKHQIYIMEGALSRAVEYGAQQLSRELRTVMPEMFLLAGAAQARGVYLEGYGIFFDVEVPMLRENMMWSFQRVVEQQNAAIIKNAVEQLRGLVKYASSPDERARVEAVLQQLAGQAAPAGPAFPGTLVGSGGGTLGPSFVAPAEPVGQDVPPLDAARKQWRTDPGRAYTEAVQRAIVDAMLDYSPPRAIGPDEWLTVAARDNEQRDTLAPADPMQEIVTVLLRIKGADLMEYRSGRIDKDQARKRVLIGEF